MKLAWGVPLLFIVGTLLRVGRLTNQVRRCSLIKTLNFKFYWLFRSLLWWRSFICRAGEPFVFVELPNLIVLRYAVNLGCCEIGTEHAVSFGLSGGMAGMPNVIRSCDGAPFLPTCTSLCGGAWWGTAR